MPTSQGYGSGKVSLYKVIRPFLFALPPETAHGLALRALQVYGLGTLGDTNGSGIERMGLRFPNRVGLAAGFDKNGVAVEGLGRLGFGFLEIGTLTPKPQSGRPKPRVFRDPARQVLINRMGFPNDGAETVARRLQTRGGRAILGVNIGKNATTPNERAMDDYVECFRKLHAVADYIAVNVSSPNTAGLRDLQDTGRLEPILAALLEERARVAGIEGAPVPLLVKVSPDLSDDELLGIAALVKRLRIEGVIATNTTTATTEHTLEKGGMSGAPLLQRALAVVRQLRGALGPEPTIIGVGGIHSGHDAVKMRNAGADLVQLYAGLIYRGPGLVGECVGALSDA